MSIIPPCRYLHCAACYGCVTLHSFLAFSEASPAHLQLWLFARVMLQHLPSSFLTLKPLVVSMLFQSLAVFSLAAGLVNGLVEQERRYGASRFSGVFTFKW